MKKLSWKPIHRGTRYCSSACGHGCTYEAYQQATHEAQAMVKRLGKPWKPRVWENLGWHWEVTAKCGSYFLTLWGCGESDGTYRDAVFTCAVSDMEGAGSPGLYDRRRFRIPENAIRSSIRVALVRARAWSEAAEAMRKLIK